MEQKYVASILDTDLYKVSTLPSMLRTVLIRWTPVNHATSSVAPFSGGRSGV